MIDQLILKLVDLADYLYPERQADADLLREAANTISRTVGQLDIIQRSIDGEDPTYIANDYGGIMRSWW